MKKSINYLIVFLTSLFVFSCAYNDDGLWSEIEKIKTDITDLKKQTSSLQTLVDALNAGKVITVVKELEEKNGYEITFNDGKTIQVLNGEAAPVISIKEDGGKYYWTVTTKGKTEFLLDNNKNKIPVRGNDGKTPQLGINSEGYWTVDGIAIKDAEGKYVKAQGDSFFKDVKDGVEEVTFTLADGSTIVIPKSPDTYLLFENPDNLQMFTMQAGSSERFRILFSNIEQMEVASFPKGWRVNLHRPDKYVSVSVPEDAAFGVYEVTLRGLDKKGMVFMAIAKISIGSADGFSDPMGTFILNEGNMTTENGSLIYISANGAVFNRIYANANGRELGNVTQDLFIKDGKMWIISQNGTVSATGTAFNNDGMLVVADASDMSRIATYDKELRDESGKYKLSWPTHIAVLNDENVFIRDNNGVSLFNSTTKQLTLINNTRGAAKNQMAVANNKIFVINGSKIMVLEAHQTDVAKTIDMGDPISGLLKAKDGNLWVSTTGTPNKISKVSSSSLSVIKSNNITDGKLGAGWGATAGITAKGDTLYYSNASTKIYRHIFSTNQSKLMVDAKEYVQNANMVYNNIAVHPLSGDVYINTIKGYGWDFTINNISVFSFDKNDNPTLKANHQDYTRFPAGIFFSKNFE